jgi:hypothetical protein
MVFSSYDVGAADRMHVRRSRHPILDIDTTWAPTFPGTGSEHARTGGRTATILSS